MKEKLVRECEKCETVIYSKVPNRANYSNWKDGAIQTGISRKYPGEIAGYCEKHIPN